MPRRLDHDPGTQRRPGRERLRVRRCVAGSHRDRRGGWENADRRGAGRLESEQGACPARTGVWRPKVLRKAFPNMPSLHTASVDRDGLRSVGWAKICGGPVDRDRRRRRPYRLSDRLQQRLAARRQVRTGVDESHPRAVAVGCPPCVFLIGESSEPSQVTPVGAGPIATVEVCQVSAGPGSK
jgi:hypothetical protein